MNVDEGSALLVLAALAAAVVLTVVRTLPPAPLPANASPVEFSAERALAHVRVLAEHPRPTGSSANATARNYVRAVLRDLGLEIATQRASPLENVLARIRGSQSADAVLLTAHLDSVAESPGASDDASGVAALLEAARALTSGGPMRNTVIFLFADFEEGGTVGARAFITEHPWARDVRVVIGLDAGGLRGPAVLSATSPDNGWLIRHLARADAHLVGSSAINALADSGTDFGHAFKPAGYSGYAFDLYWDRRIHTPDDSVANLSLRSLQHQGAHALSLARHFGMLDRLADPREPDAVYFNVLRLATVSYPSPWVGPLAIAVLALFGAVMAFGLRRGVPTWRGTGFGALVAVVGLAIAPLPNVLLGERLSSLPQSIRVGAIALVALALIVLWYAWARTFLRTSVPDLTAGALLPMAAAAAGTSIVLPALSFAFTWPLLLSLPVCASWFPRHARGQRAGAAIAGLLLAGAVSIFILGPTILLGLFDQVSLALLLLGALCAFLVPQIHLLLGAMVG